MRPATRRRTASNRALETIARAFYRGREGSSRDAPITRRPIRQAGRSRPAARRRAQVEPVARTSAAPTGRNSSTNSPRWAHRSPSSAVAPAPSSRGRSAPSRSVSETRIVNRPSGRRSDAIPADAVSAPSRARAPRSSDPQGRMIVSSSARPASSGGGHSAEATTNRAFGVPPRAADRAARRETSAIAAALASMPMTRAAASDRALAMAARPSPVPRSIRSRSWRASR